MHLTPPLFEKAEFNEKAKFNLLRENFVKILDLFPYASYRSPTTTDELKTVAKDFKIRTKMFQSSRISVENGPSSSTTL